MRQLARSVRTLAPVVQGAGRRISSFNGAGLSKQVQYTRFAFNATIPRTFATSTERLDNLGDSIKTAVVVSWNKEPGDLINEDDVIAVVETDKVTLDIRASKKGKFVEGLHATGAEVAVGDELYKMDTDTSGAKSGTHTEMKSASKGDNGDSNKKSEKSDDKKSDDKKSDDKKSESKPEKSESKESSTGPAAPPPPSEAGGDRIVVAVPIMGESITQGVLAKWMVAVNDHVSVDDIVASIETDKVNVEVKSPATGVIIELAAGEGDEVTVGGQLFTMSAKEKPASKPSADKGKEQPKEQPKESKESKPVESKEKKEAPKEQKPAAKPSPAPSSGASKSSSKEAAPEGAIPGTYVSGNRGETRVQMSRMRQRIAQRLKDSQNTSAMLTTFQEIDMTYIIDLRNKHKDDFEKKHKVKLGFMSAFVKAATGALQELPAVNGVIDDNTHEIVYRNYIDISVAVASPTGLVVPVLRNTQDLSFADIEKAIGHYGDKAKTGKIQIEDMTGGTFTISNGGVFGSLFGTPIINPPQSAILGMHATKLRPAVVNGAVVPRQMMYVALTYDHRLIDGREAVTFLKSIQAKIEDPTKLLLDL